MKLIKLVPHGFCFGVASAYGEAKKIIAENTDKKIYMLGWIVHNEFVVEEFNKLGLIVLDDKNKTRYELVDSIKEPHKAVLLLSAHGTAQCVIDLAKQKGIKIYDLTCRYVYKTHNLIKQKLIDGYDIVFIGKKHHPETIAIANISKRIKVVENEADIQQLSLHSSKIFCTNQTTIGFLFFEDILNQLKTKYPTLEYENDICDATNMRQKAVVQMPDDVDICLVIGDKRSSNCNELFQLAKIKLANSYMVSSRNEIDPLWFVNKKVCAITAAASTPIYVIKDVIDYLKSFINFE